MKLYIWILRSTGSVPYPEKQWGRKDAFPGADGSTITQATYNAATIPIYGADGETILAEDGSGYQKTDITTIGVMDMNNTLIYSIKNPLSFINNTIDLRDWFTNNEIYQNNELWNNNSKSLYDPCPAGWCTPVKETWMDFTSTNTSYYINGNIATIVSNTISNGILYNNLSWFSASGYRTNYSGILAAVGFGGNNWSVTIDSIRVKCFNFNMTNGVRPDNTTYRANGFSVRCVQE